MSIYLNPFYARASEQHRDAPQFVSTFGAGALDMLPEAIWDRLVLLRSSPGAGKTSLMRLFTVENLEWTRSRMKQTEPLHRQLLELGAIDDARPRKLGVLIDLDRDYRSLLDLPIQPEISRRLFLRLLDVRVLVGAIRGALSLHHRSFPDDISQVEFLVPGGDGRVEAMLERMGGPSGAGILEYARTTERTILRLLDALLAADVDEIPDGHNELYSLSLLADASLVVAGNQVEAQPLIMFDDGHSLERSQRDTLLNELRLRRTSVARWYAERFEALSDQELLGDLGSEGRDVVLVDLDSIARQGSKDGRRFLKGRYDRVLTDIARRRAAPLLATYAQENQEFLDLLDEDRDSAINSGTAILETLTLRVADLASGDERYAGWIDDARSLSGFDAAVRWRELEVLIQRDQDRQQDIFGAPLTGGDIDARSSAALREAATVAVANEFKLPYYAGSSIVVRLGSHNAHQFLNVCGDLFAEMLVDVSLGRPPRLSAARQHRVLHQASERLWESIPRTVPNGRDVQALVREIVAIAQEENGKPRMPYPPGVTGTALLMGERKTLLDPDYRAKNPGAERLFAALASAVAHNILNADLDYSVKNNRYMVLYLNRLLCPRFGLPLGLGGFKERRLQVMTGWMQKLPAHGSRPRPTPAAESLAL
ncbi:MAG: hypothetical protein ABIX10_02355 [Acidimicrobiales bacterium]